MCVETNQRLRILSAEDNATNRRVIELVLATIDADLVSVENGAEAVEAFAGSSFDLVLMDMQMPIMDGLCAIREIRGLEQRFASQATPILVVSANVMREDRAAALSAGADGLVGKPLVAAQLLQAIAEAVGSGPSVEVKDLVRWG